MQRQFMVMDGEVFVGLGNPVGPGIKGASPPSSGLHIASERRPRESTSSVGPEDLRLNKSAVALGSSLFTGQLAAKSPQSVDCPEGFAKRHPNMQIDDDLRKNVIDVVISKSVSTSMVEWEGVDLLELQEFSRGIRMLTTVVLVVLKCFKLIKDHAKPPKEFVNWLNKIQAAYNANDYHTALHATDVVLVLAFMLMSLEPGVLASWEILALIMAAAGHDVGHSGVSNVLLKASNDPRATAHQNDAQPPPCGPNEMAHVDTCLAFLQEEGCDWVKLQPAKQRSKIIKLMEHAIYNTDMAAHDALLNEFLHYVELFGTDVAKWTTEQAHTCFCACMLHVADISNGCKDIKVAAFWAAAITLENKCEGDRLKAFKPYSEGTPLPEHLDRAHTDVPKSQVFFLTRFLLPTFQAIALVMPKVGAAALKHGKASLAKWQAWQEKGVKSVAECLKLAGCRARVGKA